MADNTIIQQGSFISDGLSRTIVLRSGVDWMRVINITALEDTDDERFEFYWQNGFDAGAGAWLGHIDGDEHVAAGFDDDLGFNLVDRSADPLSAINNTVTSVTTAAVPVVHATFTDLVNGDVVRMINVTNADQLGGIEFTINAVNTGAGTFALPFMSQLALAGTNGSFYKVKFQPLFYPRVRTISEITQAREAEVTLTVTHGLTVGQAVRFQVGPEFGMTQINGLRGNVVAIDNATNRILVDIDTTTFTPFAFAVNGDVPFTPAQIIPIGEAANTDVADPNLTDDARDNVGYIGMELSGGETGPSGEAGDVMYWVAGKSFSVLNRA